MTTLTFPVSLADFYGKLGVRAVVFDDPENTVTSITGGGEVLAAMVAPQLWRGRVELHDLPLARAGAVQALLSVLRRPGASFLVRPHFMSYPAGDLDGSRLGAATPSILSVNADNRRLALQGLPAGYRLQRGDYLGFTYAGIRALHRVVAVEAVALSNGQTPQFEVTPLIRAGAATGQAVQLVDPSCKAVMVPGSIVPGVNQRRWTTGLSFDWVQTLK